jgi:hypothetical protein
MAGAPSPVWWLVLALPMAGLALLLAVPSSDAHWEHHSPTDLRAKSEPVEAFALLSVTSDTQR